MHIPILMNALLTTQCQLRIKLARVIWKKPCKQVWLDCIHCIVTTDFLANITQENVFHQGRKHEYDHKFTKQLNNLIFKDNSTRYPVGNKHLSTQYIEVPLFPMLVRNKWLQVTLFLTSKHKLCQGPTLESNVFPHFGHSVLSALTFWVQMNF